MMASSICKTIKFGIKNIRELWYYIHKAPTTRTITTTLADFPLKAFHFTNFSSPGNSTCLPELDPDHPQYQSPPQVTISLGFVH